MRNPLLPLLLLLVLLLPVVGLCLSFSGGASGGGGSNAWSVTGSTVTNATAAVAVGTTTPAASTQFTVQGLPNLSAQKCTAGTGITDAMVFDTPASWNGNMCLFKKNGVIGIQFDWDTGGRVVIKDTNGANQATINNQAGQLIFKSLNVENFRLNGSITQMGTALRLYSRTAAQLQALAPSAVGEMYWNSDAKKIFVSTGTTAGSFAASDDYTVGP